MAGSLTPAQVDSYAKRGYLFPLHVMSADEATIALSRLRASLAGPGLAPMAPGSERPHLLFPWTDSLVRLPSILDAVESVIGPDILCWGGQFFIKEAGDPAFVSWHQDGTYWGPSSHEVITAWLALTPSVRKNGCMRVVPGTQHDVLRHRETFAKDNLLSRGQEVAITVPEERAVDISLQAGEMSLHSALIVHGSEPNRASFPRIGLAIRYAPARARQLSGERDNVVIVRSGSNSRT